MICYIFILFWQSYFPNSRKFFKKKIFLCNNNSIDNEYLINQIKQGKRIKGDIKDGEQENTNIKIISDDDVKRKEDKLYKKNKKITI